MTHSEPLRPRQVRIAAIGVSTWDTAMLVMLGPIPGEAAQIVETIQFGGTTALCAMALARLGAKAAIISSVGNDSLGRYLIEALRTEGVNTDWIRVNPTIPTGSVVSIVIDPLGERTSVKRAGAMPRLGDQFELEQVFGYDLLVFDIFDPPLRRFLTDLPVHTVPSARVLATLTSFVEAPGPDDLDVLFRCDAVVGSEQDLLSLAKVSMLSSALEWLIQRKSGTNLKGGAFARAAGGAIAFDHHRTFAIPPVACVASNGIRTGNAFAGGFAYGLANRWSCRQSAALGTAVAALSQRTRNPIGALPTLPEAMELLSID